MDANMCACLFLVVLCNIVYCFDDHVVDTTYEQEAWTVNGYEEIINLHQGQNNVEFSYRAIWKDASIHGTFEDLDIILTDSYFVFNKIRLSPKVDDANGNVEQYGAYFLSQSELQNRSCESDEVGGLKYTTCGVFRAEIHAHCRVKQIHIGFIKIQCKLEGFKKLQKLHGAREVFLVVSGTKRHIEILHFWQKYTLRTIYDISIPLKVDSHGAKIPAALIASVGIIELLNRMDDLDDRMLPGITLRSMCFKNGMPTIMSSNPIRYTIEKRFAQNMRYLHVTVYFQLPEVEPGLYHCTWRVVNGLRNTMVSFRTNNMTCCCNDDISEYVDYMATLRPWGRDNINIHDRFIESSNAINEKLDIKMSKAQAAKQTHNNAIQICVYTLLAFIIVVFFAASCCMYRNIRKHMDECRRERMNLLEILTKIDSKPKSPIMYDIFISYSSQDSEFIETVILPGLETRGYTCCHDKRDFRLGKSVIQNICEGIYESHKTLAIFSKVYVNSNWCLQMEFALTFRRIVSDDGPTDGLVMLQYKPCMVDPVLKNENFLDWKDYGPERLDELTAVLGPPRIADKKKQ